MVERDDRQMDSVGGESLGADEQDVAASDSRRKTRASLFIALLLLLLLCSGFGALTGFEYSRAQFLARNAECLSCHTELLATMRRTSQHQPFIEKHCTSCHTPHGRRIEVRQRTWVPSGTQGVYRWLRWGPFRWLTGYQAGAANEVRTSTTSRTVKSELGESKLTAPVRTLCWSCHQTTAQELEHDTTHVPFANGDCTSCHDPHASMVEPLLVGEDELLCGQCHPMQDLFEPHLHQPAAEWNCRSCHRPHSSEHEGMLVARQRTLCLSCHPSVAGDMLLNVLHEPFVEDGCTGCHEPHGAPAQPLLVDVEPRLCYRCHSAVQEDFARVSHHPVGTKMNCSGCHWHHAGRYETLTKLPGSRLCDLCHGGIRATIGGSKHGHLDCVQCHGAHGSNYGPILRERNPEVCVRCHSEDHSPQLSFVGVSTHPVSPEYWDRFADKPLTCTSSCHNPHGTSFQYMTRDYEWYLDGMCLRCHSRVGIDF